MPHEKETGEGNVGADVAENDATVQCPAETVVEIQLGENKTHRDHALYGEQDCDIQERLAFLGPNMRTGSPIVNQPQ